PPGAGQSRPAPGAGRRPGRSRGGRRRRGRRRPPHRGHPPGRRPGPGPPGPGPGRRSAAVGGPPPRRVPRSAVPGAGPMSVGPAACVAVFVLFGALTRRAVVWSLGFVVLGERLLGTALSGVAQWSPGWEARAVYARYGPEAAGFLHRKGIPEGGSAVVRLLII